MNIVHITQFFHPERGYQENHLSILQSQQGHKVTIVCTDDLTLWGVDQLEMGRMDGDFSERYNVTIIRLAKIFEFSTRIFVKGLAKTLDALKPDLLIIHAVSLPLSLSAMKWGAKNHTRMIVDDHMVEAGSFNKLAKYFYMLFKKIFPYYLKIFNIKIDKWIAVSDETKDFMSRNYGIENEIEVVPLGFDDNTVRRDIDGGKEWLQNNKLPIDIPYILYIGKFDEMKNPIDLLGAFKIFQKEHAEYKLLMVGDPSEAYAKKLHLKIENLELTNEVFIVPSISNNQIRKVFSIAEMAIWPHGSSMAMLEAMACDCPVIAPSITVNTERLSDSRGVMFELDNWEDLAKQMNYTLIHKKELIINAKKWVDGFAWSHLVGRFY